jgi:transketolase
MRSSLVKSILEFSKHNTPPYILTGDLGYSVLEPFVQKYKNRFINVGIIEQSMMSIAAGIASQNNKVFAYSITNFSTFRALEQLRLDIAYHDLNVCVIGVGTGFQYGAAGYSHWAVEDLAIMSGLENFRIFSPSDADSTKDAVIDFLTNGGPTYIRLGKHVKNLSEVCSFKKFGQHLKIFGEGSKIIVTHGSIAIKLLDSILFDTNKFSLLVFNEVPNSLDDSFLEIFNKADSIKVLEDVVYSGSMGSRVSRFLTEKRINVPFYWKGIKGKNVLSAGGSEEFLRERELGFKYIEEILKD